jgi:hypothetical protein
MRWIAESNAWGCDRCRQLHPAQAPQQPQYQQPQYQQPAYAPQPAAGHPVPPVSQAKPKSGKGLIIVIALLVVGGGAAAAILVLKGGGGSSLGGEASRDALVDKTLAALNAGDGAALVALAPDEGKMAELDACGDKKKQDDATTERHRKQAREDADALVATTKGKGLVLDKVTEGTNGATIKKGDKMGDCTAPLDMAVHDLQIAVHDGGKKTATLEVDAMVVDGHWLLGGKPKLHVAADCKGAIDHMLGITKPDLEKAHMDIAKLTDAMVTHCQKEAWADKTLDCFAKATVGTDADTCMATLTPAQNQAVTQAMLDVMQGAKPTEPPPATPPPADDDKDKDKDQDPAKPAPPPADDEMLPECVEFAKTVERTIACKGMPQASRDALTKGLEQMRSTKTKGLPAATLKEMADTCKQTSDQLLQALPGLGC